MTRFQTTYNRYFGKDRIESIQKAGLREAFYYHYDGGIASDEEEDGQYEHGDKEVGPYTSMEIVDC